MTIRQLFSSIAPATSPIGRAFSVMAGGTAVAQLIVIVASPLITRLYSPEDFGIFAVYASLLGIISVASCFGLDVAIPLPDDDTDAANLAKLALLCVGFVGIVAAALMLVAGEVSFLASQVSLLGVFVWAIPLGVVVVGVYSVVTHWATRLRRYRYIAVSRVAQSTVLVGVQIVAGWVSGSPFGLIAGQLAGPIGGASAIGSRTLGSLKNALTEASPQHMRQVLIRYRRFPLISAPGLLIDAAGQLVPALMLAAHFGAATSGFYLLSHRVIGLPVALVTRSVSQVFLGEGTLRLRADTHQFRTLYFVTVRRLLVVGAVPVIVLAWVAPALFEIVFGQQWRIAGEYTRIFAPVLLAQLIANPASPALNMLERQDLQLTWSVIRLVLVGGVLLVAGVASWNAEAAVIGLSASMVLAYLLHVVFCWHAFERTSRSA